MKAGFTDDAVNIPDRWYVLARVALAVIHLHILAADQIVVLHASLLEATDPFGHRRVSVFAASTLLPPAVLLIRFSTEPLNHCGPAQMESLGNLTVVLAQLVQPMDLCKELLRFLLFHR